MPKWIEKDTAKETGASGKQGGWGVPKSRHDGRVGDDCFIATAAYGTPLANEVVFLQEFRDRHLLKSGPGQVIVSCYYHFGPIIAMVVRRSPLLKKLSRYSIGAIIWCLKRL